MAQGQLNLLAGCIGLVFFQGGSISTVLAGVAIKPLADKSKVSHEEASYIPAPVASSLFSFSRLYLSRCLSTEASRINFYFNSASSKRGCTGLLKAQTRAAPERSYSISSPELHTNHMPADYSPSIAEFIVPLLLLVFIAVGNPWLAQGELGILLLAIVIALLKGMSLRQVIDGIGNGLKGVIHNHDAGNHPWGHQRRNRGRVVLDRPLGGSDSLVRIACYIVGHNDCHFNFYR